MNAATVASDKAPAARRGFLFDGRFGVAAIQL